MGDEVKSSRFGRMARLGWLSRRAIPLAWKRLRETADANSDEQRAAIAEDALLKQADIAEEMFRTLGSMKGLALKIGQTISYMDGALPEAYRPVYQKVLARLQREVPALSWESIEEVIVTELGKPVDDVFASFERTPMAAASIGQVHRATLKTGEAVAVKVQYPGVDRAVASDLKNVSMMHSMMAPFLGLAGAAETSRGQKEAIAEITARILEETDYEHEAEAQEKFRAYVEHDRDVKVPRVFREQSSRRVLTSELVFGRTLQQVCDQDGQAARDRYGEILNRALCNSLYDYRLFNADPHPGNYLFPDDGRVVLLDFGCTKTIPDAMQKKMRRYMRAAIRATRSDSAEDWEAFDVAIAEVFNLDRSDEPTFELFHRFILYCLEPYVRNEPFEFTRAYSGASIDLLAKGMKDMVFRGGVLPKVPKMPATPPDFTFISRVQWGFYSVLTMLGARGSWNRALPADVRDG
jgi:predicted unusual protein kinase regulating ubiquinone biosynthesis (AarF/ABC1/UbiB family)